MSAFTLQSSTPSIPIIGLGILTPFGQNIDNFKNALQQGSCAIDFITPTDSIAPITISARIKDFNFLDVLETLAIKKSLKEKALKLGIRAPFAIQTSIIACLEAWNQAFPEEEKCASHRMGLVVTGNNTTTGISYQQYCTFKETPLRISPTYAIHFLDTNHVGYISELFNIQGEGFSIGAASASGNAALIQALRLIQLGIVDCCLVVGVIADLSLIELQALRNLNVLGGIKFSNKPKEACRPFDQQHEGFIPGQAGACMVLANEKFAQKNHVQIQGRILGYSMGLDANHLTNPSINGEAYVMHEAILKSGLKVDDINYINAHGTSSILGDEVELQACHKVFVNALDKIWINSTKSILGHCLWSAGIVESIATLIQLNHNFLHPNLNLDNPIDKTCLFVGRNKKDLQFRYALNNSFGFGGINTAIVLEGK